MPKRADLLKVIDEANRDDRYDCHDQRTYRNYTKLHPDKTQRWTHDYPPMDFSAATDFVGELDIEIQEPNWEPTSRDFFITLMQVSVVLIILLAILFSLARMATP